MITMLQGDCRELLRTLPDASVHCVVTSPPYWGLRDYGTATWQGGDPACNHLRAMGGTRNNGRDRSASNGSFHDAPSVNAALAVPFSTHCGHCGAIRIDAQLGLEPDFNAYVVAMVAVFRDVRRVLRDDGTLWLNLGDSYAGSWGNQGRKDERGTQRPINGDMLTPVHDGRYPDAGANTGSLARSPGLKPKDLCGIPWRVAFALQADGWYLRQDIIWSKPNPMPESVTDRCTKSHEYIFLLSKSQRYFYDAEAIAEPNAEINRPQSEARRAQRLSRKVAPVNGGGQSSKGIDDGWIAPSHVMQTGMTRNKRSVWEVTTQSFSEAHFATFPPVLIEPCIKAGTSEKGCCSKCGAPWRREVERGPSHYEQLGKNVGSDFARGDIDPRNQANGGGQTRNASGSVPSLHAAISITLGWSPSCACAVIGCSICSFVLDQSYETKTSSKDCGVSDMRQALPSMEKGRELLQPQMLRGQTKHVAENHLQAVQERNSADKRPPTILQQSLFDKMDGDAPTGLQGREDSNEPRLYADLESRSSNSAQERIHDGASVDNGDDAWATAEINGNRTSSEREENGQPAGEFGTNQQQQRAREEKKTNLHCDVPTLSKDISDAGACPCCGGRLVKRPPPTQPATILDCFAGAGTTGLVADRLQRNAILIELNPTYAAMGERRIVDDAPLFVEVAP